MIARGFARPGRIGEAPGKANPMTVVSARPG